MALPVNVNVVPAHSVVGDAVADTDVGAQFLMPLTVKTYSLP